MWKVKSWRSQKENAAQSVSKKVSLLVYIIIMAIRFMVCLLTMEIRKILTMHVC